MEVYEGMAELYDLVYSDSQDLDFYLTEARNAKGPVLEAGCGTGRILLALLAEGIDATGIDSSGAMLGMLRKKAEKLGLQPDVLEADMRSFRIGKKFRLIIVPYRSFLHLMTEEDRKRALMGFMEHLASGGRLIIHSYAPSEEEKACSGGYHHVESSEVAAPDGKPCRVEWHLDYDRRAGVGRYLIKVFKGGKEHGFRMDLAFMPVEAMRSLLSECGYRNVKACCGFDYLPYAEGCQEVVWFAEKG